MGKKKIVVSGINIRNSGTLTIYHNFLDEIIENKLYKKYEFIAMVSSKDLFQKYSNYIELIEFSKEKKSRIMRFYYEYFYFNKYSKKEEIYIWISLNDKTPKVCSKYQYVYCHNPSIFYKCTLKDIYFSLTFYFYTLLYNKLYKHNIECNNGVIVQQSWIAEEFLKKFPIDNIYIMRPEFNERLKKNESKKKDKKETIFIYPTAPRSFKNCEVILEASKILQDQGIKKYRIYLTIKGHENRYAQYLYKNYSEDSCIKFCGFLKKDDLEELYKEADCLIFPSKLETWGLPMTEFKKYNRNIIAADLPYAHETLEGYERVAYFNTENSIQLSALMKEVIGGREFINTVEKNNNKKEIRKIKCWTEFIGLIERGML